MSKPKRKFNIAVNERWCKNCGICIAFCPAKVFDQGVRGEPIVARPDACVGCQMCVLRCPDFALDVSADGDVAGEADGKAS